MSDNPCGAIFGPQFFSIDEWGIWQYERRRYDEAENDRSNVLQAHR